MNEDKNGLNISARSFIIAVSVIFLLMVITYALTFVIPGGSYERITDAAGNTVIDTSSPFTPVEGGIPFWKWLLSPLLVLGADGNVTIIAVLIFVIVIGGSFESLSRSGIISFLLRSICSRFAAVRYKLMAAVTAFFMLMGALVGSFEEVVPMVPIVIAMSISLGWDALTGLGMSLVAVGCGFASGLFNPFTVGVAQSLAGVPLFSGAWLRALTLLLIYPLLLVFLRAHAKKADRGATNNARKTLDDPRLKRAAAAFVAIMGVGLAIVLSSSLITVLQDYTMILFSLGFLLSGLIAPKLAGMDKLGRTYLNGIKSMLPAVAMILMASSIRYTLEEAKLIDTILHSAVEFAGSMPQWTIVLFIYLVVLVMNFFVGSGSAKAFMLIPLLVPLAGAFGISAQLCILAFAFGDGFSNIFYPTNAVTLISLGIADVDYGRWARWTLPLQIFILIITCGLLMLGLSVGY